MNACILAAALEKLKMHSLSDVLTFAGVSEPQNFLWLEECGKQRDVLPRVCTGIVDDFASFIYYKA